MIWQHAIWLYQQFTLSCRDVEEMLAERGIEVSCETVRRWVMKFGPALAGNFRRLRHKPSPRWHLQRHLVSRRILRSFRVQTSVAWRIATAAV